ncbi:MAG TPA: hypothetical protein VIC62_09220 [Nakamurella sp.]|jgi:hypothetical protein
MYPRITDGTGSTAQWLPATRVGSSPLRVIQGARVFASFAAILLAARRAG